MNSNSTSQSNGRHRFIEDLVASDLFQQYQTAFHALTALPLSLRGIEESEAVEQVVTSTGSAGVVTTQVPVRVGRNVVAIIQVGGVRLASASTASGTASPKHHHHASHARAAQVPMMEPERYDAAVTLLCAFALQLGESAQRMLFAYAAHEPESVRNAKTFIESHLTERMSLDAVASAVHVSSFHFCKLFKRATGITFTDFVTRARVEKAKRLLVEPSARVTEIAYDVGFQSLSRFNRCFRRIAAESPTDFRSRMKAQSANSVMAAA